MQDTFHGFLSEYFISPIISHSGYNPVNTIVYAMIAVVICFFVIYPYLDKKKIKFDYNFALSVIPYVVLGSTLRIFEESHSTVHLIERSANPLELGFYFLSPGIYIMIGIATVASLLISIKIAKKRKINPLKVFRNIGIILASPVVIWHLFHLTHPEAFIGIAVTASPSTALAYHIFKKKKKKLFRDRLNVMALFGQALDGSATSIILQFYPVYKEQHFVSNAIIQAFGPFAFLITKIAVCIMILYLIDMTTRSKEVTKNFAGFVKILIIILGIATGTRDMFSVSMTTAI